jgi:membrane fusion protein (multidrug efflux system)
VVQPGLWVTANFKETQLTDMRPGQSVRLHVDAFPDQELTGHVDSLQNGTGSMFSALPAENATGNYVKVVQRLPVKITLDGDAGANLPLAVGMSVTPSVAVR